MVLGGYPSYTSVEYWSAENPEEESCVLSGYPENIIYYPTTNFVSGKLITCYENNCEIYNNGVWTHLVSTIYTRSYGSSAQTEDRILLIGGSSSPSTTEWISLDGSASQHGPFTNRHSYHHCTIQLSSDLIVVTGGYSTQNYVTEYQLTTGAGRGLAALNRGRYYHACGVYNHAGQQVNQDSHLLSMNIIHNAREGTLGEKKNIPICWDTPKEPV